MSLSNETNRKLVARLKTPNMMDKVLFPHVLLLMSNEGKHFITGIFDIRTSRILFCELIFCSVKSCHGKREPGEKGEQSSSAHKYAKALLLINVISFIPAAPLVTCAGTCFQPLQI